MWKVSPHRKFLTYSAALGSSLASFSSYIRFYSTFTVWFSLQQQQAAVFIKQVKDNAWQGVNYQELLDDGEAENHPPRSRVY